MNSLFNAARTGHDSRPIYEAVSLKIISESDSIGSKQSPVFGLEIKDRRSPR